MSDRPANVPRPEYTLSIPRIPLALISVMIGVLCGVGISEYKYRVIQIDAMKAEEAKAADNAVLKDWEQIRSTNVQPYTLDCAGGKVVITTRPAGWIVQCKSDQPDTSPTFIQ